MRWVHLLVLGAALGSGAAAAQTTAKSPAEPVYTRARVVSVDPDAGSSGKRYVRLKLLPRAKLPFTTQAFRVMDAALLADIAPGAWVKFTSRHIDGDNTLTSIQVVAECRRFEPCD